jgi:hypothetical protein
MNTPQHSEFGVLAFDVSGSVAQFVEEHDKGVTGWPPVDGFDSFGLEDFDDGLDVECFVDNCAHGGR